MNTIAQKLVSGSLLRTMALVANGVVAFMLFPFLVHHLGDRQYGFWALAGTFVGYYGMLDFGLTGTVGQYISGAIGRKDDQECNVIFNAALRIHSLMGVAALVVTLALAALAPVFLRSPQDASLFWKVILLVGLTVTLSFPLNTYQGLLLAGLRFDVVSWLALLTLTLRTTLIIWVVLAGRGLTGIAWAGLLAALPSSLLTLWITHRQFPWMRILAGSAERKTTKSLFSYSAYLFITDIADRLRFQVDPLVITAFIGLAAVTHYRIASVFADQYMRVMISVVGVFWPLLSQFHAAGEDARIKKTFFLATKISLCMAIFLCFGLITWGRPMIERWMGPSYTDSYWPLVVLTLAMLLDLCQMPTVSLLFATFKHRVYAFLNLAEGILNLGVSLMLVRQYGILGVALGTLVAAIVIRIVIQPWWMCKVSNISYWMYVRFLSRTSFRCAGLIAACLPLIYWGLKPDYTHLFSSAACATILYALGTWVAVFDKNERQVFRAGLRKRDKQSAPVAEVRTGTVGPDAGKMVSLSAHEGA
jgi:O-antigen/teichoic acid export membrane protein